MAKKYNITNIKNYKHQALDSIS